MARPKIIETENDVKNKLVTPMLDKEYAWHYAPIQTGMGEHGIPDRIACVPVLVTADMVGTTVGLFVAIEAKRPGRRHELRGGASPAQVNQLHGILDAGGLAMLVDSEEDLEHLHRALAALRTGNGSKYVRTAIRNLLEARTKQNG